jgi:hypothetical protein
MDDGRLFSQGRVTDAETMAFAGAPAWGTLPPDDMRRVGPQATEVEWFAFDGKIYRRERTGPGAQRLVLAAASADVPTAARQFLALDELPAVARSLGWACTSPVVVDAHDSYAIAAVTPGAPVYRLACGDVWFHIDGANGALLDKLDRSRRLYRWLFRALHTFDIPALIARPTLRTVVIVALCGLGLAFSLTAVVIGWCRLNLQS